MEAKEETYLQSCKNIMRTLLSKKYKNLNWIFKDPLDPTALGLDDYKKIVKYPLDLGTISRRLRVKYYLNPFHFVTDVRRVFENTYLYTTPGHLCYVMAQKLESIFEDLVAKYIPFCSHGSGVKIDKVQYFDFNRCDARDEEAESNIDSGDDDIIGDDPHTYEDTQYEYVASDANDDDKDLEEPMTLEFDSYLQVSLQQLEGVMLHKVFHMIYQSEDLHFQHPIKKIKFDVRRLKVKTKRAIIEYIESQGMSGKRACRLKDL
ncbi:hypothetical protein KR215_002509 [Drosophila sulfurigaster]|nr:hypothetical protein KR215_002509 [Drosophila sulfurigaster]